MQKEIYTRLINCDNGFIFNREGAKLSAQIAKSRAGLSRDSIVDIL